MVLMRLISPAHIGSPSGCSHKFSFGVVRIQKSCYIGFIHKKIPLTIRLNVIFLDKKYHFVTRNVNMNLPFHKAKMKVAGYCYVVG
jgi:hypothetical protein